MGDHTKIVNFSESLDAFDQCSEDYLESQDSSTGAQKWLTQSRKLLNLSLNNSNISFKSKKLLLTS